MRTATVFTLLLTMLAVPLAAQDFGSVAGTVSTEDGDPVPRAQVILRGDGGNHHGGHLELLTVTDHEGGFGFPRVPVGAYQITAMAMRMGMAEEQIEVAAGEETVVDLVLAGHGGGGDDQQFGSVAGTVSTEDGNPVPRAQVILRGDGGDNHGGHLELFTVTDREGGFGFPRVPVGAYQITAMAMRMGMAEEQIEVAADEETFVELIIAIQGGDDEDEFGGVAGTVSDPDGNPIPRAEIMLMPNRRHHQPGHQRMVTHSDEDGTFAFDEVPVGAYQIVAGAIGYIPFQDELAVAENEVTEVEIVLNPLHDDDLEFGSVFGNVSDADGAPIELAHVMLIPAGHDRNNPGHHGRHGWREPPVAFTDADGNFEFDRVPVGDYIARAAKRGYEHQDREIAVAVDEATEVNFTLDAGGGGGHGGHRGGHERPHPEIVELRGTVIVIDGDHGDIYLLDEDGDDEADYILNFGPPDYQPDNGLQRPEDGDEIDIVGMTMGHMEPPMVMVYMLNGEVWRERDGGDHGGRRGGGNGWGDDRGVVEVVEAEGFAIVSEGGDDHRNWIDQYPLDTDEDEAPNFRLCFGAPDYDPGNGVERPADGDFINIVGGLVPMGDRMPVIIVYQINGNFWREPGDTLQMFWELPESVEDGGWNSPVSVALLEAYPNPFNPAAVVRIEMAQAGNAELNVYDALGRLILNLNNGSLTAGVHNFSLNGAGLQAGAYYIRAVTPEGSFTRQITLIK